MVYVGTDCQMSMEHRHLPEQRSNSPCLNISMISWKRPLLVWLVVYLGTGCQMSMEHRHLPQEWLNFPCWNIEKMTVPVPQLQNVQMILWRLRRLRRLRRLMRLMVYVGTDCQMSMKHRHLLEERSNFLCWNISMISWKRPLLVVLVVVYHGTGYQMSMEHRHLPLER